MVGHFHDSIWPIHEQFLDTLKPYGCHYTHTTREVPRSRGVELLLRRVNRRIPIALIFSNHEVLERVSKTIIVDYGVDLLPKMRPVRSSMMRVGKTSNFWTHSAFVLMAMRSMSSCSYSTTSSMRASVSGSRVSPFSSPCLDCPLGTGP